jgi:hypothetical protein
LRKSQENKHSDIIPIFHGPVGEDMEQSPEKTQVNVRNVLERIDENTVS